MGITSTTLHLKCVCKCVYECEHATSTATSFKLSQAPSINKGFTIIVIIQFNVAINIRSNAWSNLKPLALLLLYIYKHGDTEYTQQLALKLHCRIYGKII